MDRRAASAPPRPFGALHGDHGIDTLQQLFRTADEAIEHAVAAGDDEAWRAVDLQALHLPVLIHIADPVAFFDPLDSQNERWEELHAHPDWHFPSPPFPPFLQLMDEFADLIITSPGVPPKAWIIQEAEKRNIKIISELELGAFLIFIPLTAQT